MFRPTCWRLAHFNDWKLALIRKVEVHFIRQGAKMLSSKLHPWWPFKHTMAVLHGNNNYLCQKWMSWSDIFSSQIYISRNQDGRLPFLGLCFHFHWPLWCTNIGVTTLVGVWVRVDLQWWFFLFVFAWLIVVIGAPSPNSPSTGCYNFSDHFGATSLVGWVLRMDLW